MEAAQLIAILLIGVSLACWTASFAVRRNLPVPEGKLFALRFLVWFSLSVCVGPFVGLIPLFLGLGWFWNYYDPKQVMGSEVWHYAILVLLALPYLFALGLGIRLQFRNGDPA